MKPQESEYPAYYHRYIAALGDVDLAVILRTQIQAIESLGAMMNDHDALFRYAEGKWSIKEVLGHLIDCERVFAYRAMCIARGEAQPLPGFDEDAYVANAAFDARSLRSLVEEFTPGHRTRGAGLAGQLAGLPPAGARARAPCADAGRERQAQGRSDRAQLG